MNKAQGACHLWLVTAIGNAGGYFGDLTGTAVDRRLGRWLALPLPLAVTGVIFDGANRIIRFGPLSAGPLDEVAHLATAALFLSVLALLVEVPGRFYVAALIASVAIDLDHIPDYLGLLGNQNGRPFTHSLATVAVFAAAASISHRRRVVLTGIVTGLLVHFARDIAEGPPGVRMLWPLAQTAWIAGYWWFLGPVIVLTLSWLLLAGLRAPLARWRVFPPIPDSA